VKKGLLYAYVKLEIESDNQKAASPTQISFPLSAGPLSPAFEAAQAAIIGQSPSDGSSAHTPHDQDTPGGQGSFPDQSLPLASPLGQLASPQYASPDSPFFTNSLSVSQDFSDHVMANGMPSSTSALSEAEAFQAETVPAGLTGQSPRLSDLLSPGTDMSTPAPEFFSFMSQYQESFPPHTPITPLTDMIMDEDDDVEEIVRADLNQPWNARFSPSSSSPGSSDGSGGFFPGENPYMMLKEPQFGNSSPEMMTLRFDRKTCGILSVKDGPTENPWRTLIWPMARDSPALYHAIASMTSFHESTNQPQMRVQGLEHMRASIHTLANGIASMSLETAIATTLTLAFSESWDQHISTGIDHIKGARVLVNQALTKHRQSAYRGDQLSRLKFLCNTWVYQDVIARLTSADNDDSNDFDSVYDMLPDFSGAEVEVDPLMGCAQTLFPIIGRVANLVRQCRSCESNTPAMISHAVTLKTLLEGWAPPIILEEPEDPTSQSEENQQTAEAYRWATLLYLHQAVPEIPSPSSAELARKVLVYLATVPLSSRTVIVQIYPLTAAGCEASDEATRKFVRERWESMAARMKIGVIDRCFEVTKEVWSRRDEYEAKRNSPTTAASTLPLNTLKRSLDFDEEGGDEFEWQADMDGFGDGSGDGGGGKRRAMASPNDLPRPVRIMQQEQRSRKRSSDMRTGVVDREYTVRGSLHWLGVMRDWNWEGKLSDPLCRS